MTFQELEKTLIKGKRILQPITNGNVIESKEGYYSIWITNTKKLMILSDVNKCSIECAVNTI